MVGQILSTSGKQQNATATAIITIVVARIIFEAPGSNCNRLDEVDDCETS